MAVDICSDIPNIALISPRISFSHDLNQESHSISSIQDFRRARLDSSLLDTDFNFCISNSFVQEFSSADELFSNGKILPIEIKKHKNVSISTNHQQQPENNTEQKKLLKEFLSMSIDADDHNKPVVNNRSFWQFKRSNSLNCDSTTRTKGLIRSFQFLSRSKSTGSAPSRPKPALLFAKENQKQPQLQKQHSVPSRKSPSVASFGEFYGYNNSISGQKRPSLRKCGSYGGNGVRIATVLNLPPPYISRGTVNLFGLGSLFCNGSA
ncbi:uncharacterized protein LOC126672785 [Mercurialis annua]|uniref:uncharacterized protein LOC126672785 n=1 Tax=Mercurialis annua TaxID=3986 RepID=UPI0024ACC673|nr:uncharacterized protein LOC126672785 [Mercurialis annua]